MGWGGFAAVGLGAAAGAWLRWWLGVVLNPLFPTVPLGTLTANLVGGVLIGIAMGVLDHFQTVPVEARLLLTTGFLGGLTTFSTFSAETVSLLVQGAWSWALVVVFAHLLGSILMTLAGLGLVRVLLQLGAA